MQGGEDKTVFGTVEQAADIWWERMKRDPKKTLLKSILVLFIIAAAVVALQWVGWYFGPHEPRNLFKATQTIHSNVVPNESDIIDLDHAGTLTPSPYNVPFALSSEGVCVPDGTILPYSQGIELVLNITPTLRTVREASGGSREITFKPPVASNYFPFKPGTEKEISTNGRKFLVTLSRINDLSTPENGEYYSYVFNINEK